MVLRSPWSASSFQCLSIIIYRNSPRCDLGHGTISINKFLGSEHFSSQRKMMSERDGSNNKNITTPGTS